MQQRMDWCVVANEHRAADDAGFAFPPITAGDGSSACLNTQLEAVPGQQGIKRRQWNVCNCNYVFDGLRQALTMMTVA